MTDDPSDLGATLGPHITATEVQQRMTEACNVPNSLIAAVLDREIARLEELRRKIEEAQR